MFFISLIFGFGDWWSRGSLDSSIKGGQVGMALGVVTGCACGGCSRICAILLPWHVEGLSDNELPIGDSFSSPQYNMPMTLHSS